jgi:anti-sigma factor ChrR (cupin superfamily)
MKPAPIPADDAVRVADLRALNILDTPREARFDRITDLAADVFGAKMCFINLVDADRQWFKSTCGLDGVSDTQREPGFCADAIFEPDAMVVPDATKDARFADNPFVTGEYVLGTMEAERRRDFEARLQREPALRAIVARWEAVLAGLEDGAQHPPPAELWSRLARALDHETSPDPVRTVRQAEGDWTEIGPGLQKKHLYRDSLTGLDSCLIRMQPGAVFKAHHHAHAEECLVLEGDLLIGDQHLKAGDYQVAAPGTQHPALKSESGGLIYVRGAVAFRD